DRRCRIPTATGLLLLLKNLPVAREPLYGLSEWAARHVPELLGLSPTQLASLNDDRVGRCLDRLFDADVPTLTLAVVVRAVREFAVELDELHNDSTTITLHGDYEAADQERTLRGRLRAAITWGHNKDHRPDLKQLLFILTVARDGAVPVQFRVQSGNVTDDVTHRDTWDLLCKLTHRREHGLSPPARRPVPQRFARNPRRGRRLPRVACQRPGHEAADLRQDRRGRDAPGPLQPVRAGSPERRRIPADLVPQREQGGIRLRGAAAAGRPDVDAVVGPTAEARLAADAVSAAGQGRGGGGRDPPGVGQGEVVHDHDQRAGIRDVSPGGSRPPDGADAVREADQGDLRVEVSARTGAAVGGGQQRWVLPADHQRVEDHGAGVAAGVQGSAGVGAPVRPVEDGLRGGAGVPEGGEPARRVVVRVLLRAAGGGVVGARAAPGDGTLGVGKLAAVPGGPSVPASDGSPDDRPVRG